ncbi:MULTISPECIES: WD40 repeat domain-containing protein [Streptomyces]|uniref:WD40 repeat domain-containing protein n=1 Tax=Streptomyces TaxID=1883 RepID=UPI001BEEE313|nr:WD40 repeat domain-containing protein [Streptomyces sp. EAS-AB2608]BCM66081.1 hypothetical protein EASAB2608_01415 [Streptomyces sp. EAS-AB2608]
MNVEELVREVLREQADAQPPVPAGFADRVLGVRRRRRTRRLLSVAAATAAVVAVAVGVPLLHPGGNEVRPAAVPAPAGIRSHPDQSPPRELIAAGRTAMAAYYTRRTVPQGGDRGVTHRTYWLLNPETGRYEKDARWSFVAVAPGLRTAAVLERTLPAARIGLLDLATGEVERWIPVSHGVAGLAFSDDGRRLVATAYSANPDQAVKVADAGNTGRTDWGPWWQGKVRTGFHVVDVSSGKATWSAVPPGRNDIGRLDFAFSRTGDLVYSQAVGGRDGMQQFYDLTGRKAAAPADERHLRSDVPARLSPDGRLGAWGLVAEPHRMSYSAIRDPLTGEEIGRARGAQLLAWADDRRLIAWERDPERKEYRDRLVLVTIGEKGVVPLSGYRKPNAEYHQQEWNPVFAER